MRTITVLALLHLVHGLQPWLDHAPNTVHKHRAQHNKNASTARRDASAGVAPTHASFRAVFVWSSGHAGTTTLASTLRGLALPGVLVHFEETPPPPSPLAGSAGNQRAMADCATSLAAWVREEYTAWIAAQLRTHRASVYVTWGSANSEHC